MMRDPDMTFLKGADGEYYPLSFRQDSLAIDQDAIVWDEKGDIKGFNAKRQADMTSFANGWMENIRDQQMLTLRGDK